MQKNVNQQGSKCKKITTILTYSTQQHDSNTPNIQKRNKILILS